MKNLNNILNSPTNAVVRRKNLNLLLEKLTSASEDRRLPFKDRLLARNILSELKQYLSY